MTLHPWREQLVRIPLVAQPRVQPREETAAREEDECDEQATHLVGGGQTTRGERDEAEVDHIFETPILRNTIIWLWF